MRLPIALAAAASLLTVSAPALADHGWRGGPQPWGYQNVPPPPGYAYPEMGYYQPVRGGAQGGWYDPRFEGRDPCRNRGGATGAVLGAVVGGVIGNQVAGRGDRTLGTVLGAGVGAVAGSAIERSGRDRRCRW